MVGDSSMWQMLLTDTSSGELGVCTQ
jgi:hypothetical protein